jgi:hypothetical protein
MRLWAGRRRSNIECKLRCHPRLGPINPCGFEDPPAPGSADHDSTMAIFRRVRDKIRGWLKDEFIPAASAPPNS